MIELESKSLTVTPKERTQSFSVDAPFGVLPSCYYKRQIVSVDEKGNVIGVQSLAGEKLDVASALGQKYSITREDGSTLTMTGAEYMAMTAEIFDREYEALKKSRQEAPAISE